MNFLAFTSTSQFFSSNLRDFSFASSDMANQGKLTNSHLLGSDIVAIEHGARVSQPQDSNGSSRDYNSQFSCIGAWRISEYIGGGVRQRRRGASRYKGERAGGVVGGGDRSGDPWS